MIAAIGGGRSVGSLGQALGLEELPVLRGVKEIVELGLVAVGEQAPRTTVEPAPAVPIASVFAPVAEPAEVTDLRSQWDDPRGTNGSQQWDEQTVGEWEESSQEYVYQPHDMAGPSSSEMTGLGEAGLLTERYEADPYPETVELACGRIRVRRSGGDRPSVSRT